MAAILPVNAYTSPTVEKPLFDPDGNGPYRVLRAFARRGVDLLHRSSVDPEGVAQECLKGLLAGLEGTAFAEDHGLTGEESLEAWRERVPIRSHDDLRGYLDRVVAGEGNVLTREKVESVLKTSGTTGPAKWLPVTRSWEKDVALGQSLWRLALIRDHEEVTRGKVLTVVSPAVEGHLPSGLPYGSNTGRMQAAQPWIVRMRYAVPGEVFSISDPEARAYTLLRFALQASVTSITTANPSTLLLLARKLREHAESLAADLAEGSLARGPATLLQPEEQRSLARRLKKGVPPEDWRLARIWDLVCVQCWKGGSAPFFLERLPEALGREVPVREVGITASEGYFAIPLSDEDLGGVAWLGGHLLEFVDEEGRVYWPWELQSGCQYRLVISTRAGLYRYDLDDVLEVVGWEGAIPRLRFVRKGCSMLNLTGEKLTEDQVSSAVGAVFAGLQLRGFTAGHLLAEVPAVVVGVEGLSMPLDPDLAPRLEAALCAANVEYQSKRESGRLGPACLRVLPPGTYDAYRAQRLEEGAPEAQVKEPVVARDAEAWSRVLSAAENAAPGDR